MENSLSPKNDNMLDKQKLRAGKFQCDICDEKFSTKRNLILHVRVHTFERQLECIVCGKTFNRKDHLTNHEMIHRDDKPDETFICKDCGKNFRRYSSLQRHQTIHSGEKPFLCKVCGKNFKRSAHLKVHSFIHTGEKFSCFVVGCNKRFSDMIYKNTLEKNPMNVSFVANVLHNHNI